jgi:threonine synthase
MDKAGYQFSSANSINIGRLVPQIVYYVYAYGRLLKEHEISRGEAINVTVPTGNFGNILAAYYAKCMGLPIKKLICASNDNKVLYDFFRTGTYDKNREFILTTSPSMDILISSNLERLIYKLTGNDPKKTADFMASLATDGKYTITEEMRKELADFAGGFADEQKVAGTIKRICNLDGYLIDPHTAVAAYVSHSYQSASGDQVKMLIASTASPFKFTRSVMNAINPKYDSMSDFELVDELSELSGVKVPQAIEDIRSAKVLHNTVCAVDKMQETVEKILQI